MGRKSVLGRPFGERETVRRGQQVLLGRIRGASAERGGSRMTVALRDVKEEGWEAGDGPGGVFHGGNGGGGGRGGGRRGGGSRFGAGVGCTSARGDWGGSRSGTGGSGGARESRRRCMGGREPLGRVVGTRSRGKDHSSGSCCRGTVGRSCRGNGRRGPRRLSSHGHSRSMSGRGSGWGGSWAARGDRGSGGGGVSYVGCRSRVSAVEHCWDVRHGIITCGAMGLAWGHGACWRGTGLHGM